MPSPKKSKATSKRQKQLKKKSLPKPANLIKLENNLVTRAKKINHLYRSINFCLGLSMPGVTQSRIPYLSRKEAAQIINDIKLFSRLFANYHTTLSEKAGVLGKSAIGFRHALTVDMYSLNKLFTHYSEIQKRFPDLAKKKLSEL